MRIPAGAERPWPLSHVPLLIDPAEWQALEGRAHPARRAARSDPRGHLRAGQSGARGAPAGRRRRRQSGISCARSSASSRPAARICGSTASMSGRSPDGRWWVLGDRTQAPSGAGYALENRLALSRAMPDIYRQLRVERVAPFFQALQADLSALEPPRRFAGLRADARPAERDLFRARLSRALSRLPAGRRRGPDGPRRRRVHPHRVRTEARRGAAAPPRCRFRRSAGAQRPLAARRAGSRAGDPRRHRGDGQCARLRRGRGARHAELPAGACAAPCWAAS